MDDDIIDRLDEDKPDFSKSAEFESLSNQMWGIILNLPDCVEKNAIKNCWSNLNAFIKYGN